jgi:hypothetical protein
MNERIKQLAEQCTVQEFSDCTGGFETFDQEKFAELIIRECADIATINAHQWASPGTYVLKHFGVEE